MGMADGKIGIVTGAAQGLGYAAAERLAKEGARVALVDINRDAVYAAADQLKADGCTDVIAIAADVSREDETVAMLDETERRLGNIRYIYQNAAIQVEKLLHETTLDDWDRLMSINLRSMFIGARNVIPRMLGSGGGSIVNSASILSLSADQLLPAYSTSKHGVLGLTRAIAVTETYAMGGIRCNCICPGDVRTPMVQRYFNASPDPVQAEKETTRHYPMKRIGEPSEAAAVVCFLVSDMSSFMNGEYVVVDGGVMAKCY